MDRDTYATYGPFGTDCDRHGNLIRPGAPRHPRLSSSERVLYQSLLHSDHAGHRRIEQERIPLDIAFRATLKVERNAGEINSRFADADNAPPTRN